jgi:hypothetical protein
MCPILIILLKSVFGFVSFAFFEILFQILILVFSNSNIKLPNLNIPVTYSEIFSLIGRVTSLGELHHFGYLFMNSQSVVTSSPKMVKCLANFS